jgi:glutamate synthase domain-containing protein 1
MVIQAGCSTAGILNRAGTRFGSSDIVNAMNLMSERNNGLGAGFVVYGLYPENKNEYAFHVMYNNDNAKEKAEQILKNNLTITGRGKIPCETRLDAPLLNKYFVSVPKKNLSVLDEQSFIARCVDQINSLSDAYVMSSGKNVGVFKGVGFPQDIASFYKLEKYKGHMWISHGRFPTNTPGSWFGAHPFNLLDISVVHNGEVSSYGANKRFLESYGYRCSLKTDTEVFVYLLDLLLRKHKLPLETACKVLAPPFWNTVKDSAELQKLEVIRRIYSGGLIGGPFSIIVGHNKGMFGLNDRIKLRPMFAAEKDDLFLIASEEAALKKIASSFDKVRVAEAGIPVAGELYV